MSADRPLCLRAKALRMWGFPHSYDPERVKGELRVGVALRGWSPVIWIPMKGA